MPNQPPPSGWIEITHEFLPGLQCDLWLPEPGLSPATLHKVALVHYGGAFQGGTKDKLQSVFNKVGADGETPADKLGLALCFTERTNASETVHPYPQTLDELRACIDWLETQPNLDMDNLGAIGTSAGGWHVVAQMCRGDIKWGVTFDGGPSNWVDPWWDHYPPGNSEVPPEFDVPEGQYASRYGESSESGASIRDKFIGDPALYEEASLTYMIANTPAALLGPLRMYSASKDYVIDYRNAYDVIRKYINRGRLYTPLTWTFGWHGQSDDFCDYDDLSTWIQENCFAS